MRAQKRLFAVVGAMVVGLILVVGTLVGVVPLLTQAASTRAQTAAVDDANAQTDVRVRTLRFAKQSLPQRQKDLAQIRAQVPESEDLDQVFGLAASAAHASGSTVESIGAADPQQFQARTAATLAAQEAQKKTAPDTETSPTSVSSGPAAKAESTSDTDLRRQVPLTIRVRAASPERAMDFLDGLRAGPRLVAVIHTTLTPSGTQFVLEVDALAFSRGNG